MKNSTRKTDTQHMLSVLKATFLFLASLFFLWLGGVASIAAYHATHETFQTAATVFAGMSFFAMVMLWFLTADAMDDAR